MLMSMRISHPRHTAPICLSRLTILSSRLARFLLHRKLTLRQAAGSARPNKGSYFGPGTQYRPPPDFFFLSLPPISQEDLVSFYYVVRFADASAFPAPFLLTVRASHRIRLSSAQNHQQ